MRESNGHSKSFPLPCKTKNNKDMDIIIITFGLGVFLAGICIGYIIRLKHHEEVETETNEMTIEQLFNKNK